MHCMALPPQLKKKEEGEWSTRSLTTISSHQFNKANTILETLGFCMCSIDSPLSLLHSSVKTKGPVNHLKQKEASKGIWMWYLLKPENLTYRKNHKTSMMNTFKRCLKAHNKLLLTAISLSIVFGIPTTETFNPRFLTSCKPTLRFLEDQA